MDPSPSFLNLLTFVPLGLQLPLKESYTGKGSRKKTINLNYKYLIYVKTNINDDNTLFSKRFVFKRIKPKRVPGYV